MLKFAGHISDAEFNERKNENYLGKSPMQKVSFNNLLNRPSKGYKYFEAIILDFKGPRPIGAAEKKSKATYTCLIHLACLNTRTVFNIVLKNTKEICQFFSVQGMAYRGRVISLINAVKSHHRFYGLPIVMSTYRPILMPGMSSFSNEIHVTTESTGEVAASSKEAKYEVFVFKADPDDLTFINCDLVDICGKPHCDAICSAELERCCAIDARRNCRKAFCVYIDHKDLTELAGNDDCEISYCSSSFINTIIDTNFLKNETPSSIVKQEFFVESLDEWKTLIKDQQDYIRIVVISRSQYLRDDGGETSPRLFKIVSLGTWKENLPGWNKKVFKETVEEMVSDESENLAEEMVFDESENLAEDPLPA